MALTGGTVVGISLPGVFVKLTQKENLAIASELRPDGRPRIPPNQQAVKALRDMGGYQGLGRVPEWKLHVHGEVQKPVTFTFKQLLELQAVDITCDVHCVTGWTLLDSKWRGLPAAFQ